MRSSRARIIRTARAGRVTVAVARIVRSVRLGPVTLQLDLDDDRGELVAARRRPGRVHGTRRGYQRRCPCVRCQTEGREDNTRYMRAYRAGERGKRKSPRVWVAA